MRLGAGEKGGTGPGKGASIRGAEVERGARAGCRQILVWWCHASESLSLSLSRSWCVGGNVGSSGCSAEENGKKGRWMEWRPGMIRRRSRLGCGVCPVVVIVVVVVVVVVDL